ncbi:MAG: hypothetical protein IPK13_11205 [Deltaproteobacteria bacterium]|nr:hypothetical protein [Deltaproteobacteria bacterium]
MDQSENATFLEGPAPGDESFPVMDLTFQFLVLGERERFRFVERGDEALDRILRALFLTETNHEEALVELLRLSIALREQLESPTAAQQIIDALIRSKEAMNVIGRDRERRSEVLGEFSRFQGARGRRLAPTFGSAAPKGSLKVSSFLTPAQQPGPGISRIRRPSSRTR